MADFKKDKKEPSKTGWDMEFETWIVFAIIAIVVLGGVFGTLNENYGIDLTDPAGSILNVQESFKLQPLTANTPLGTKVKTLTDTKVWELAGGGTLLGSQDKGAFGTLIDGPRLVQGERWWMVDFEETPDGWVAESALGAIPSGFAGTVYFLIRRGILISYLVSGVLIILLGIIFYRLEKLRKAEQKKIKLPGLDAFIPSEHEVFNEKWQHIQELVQSGNPSQWREAIVEADIMLDNLLNTLGFTEGTIGDKLKLVEPSDFDTLDDAWEAHKIRNKIVHEGSDFIVTPEIKDRAISLYANVFREFELI